MASGPYNYMLEGDAHLLTRAVENLLDNALRHSPPGGGVSVYWERAAGCWRFAVRDSGPGIAPVDLPHIFDPLYRGEASRNRGTGGAGLGLAIAQRILRVHGGDLAAANHPDGGAELTATLPVKAHEATISESVSAANG
jgi:signal transduction histidine kinase